MNKLRKFRKYRREPNHWAVIHVSATASAGAFPSFQSVDFSGVTSSPYPPLRVMDCGLFIHNRRDLLCFVSLLWICSGRSPSMARTGDSTCSLIYLPPLIRRMLYVSRLLAHLARAIMSSLHPGGGINLASSTNVACFS